MVPGQQAEPQDPEEVPLGRSFIPEPLPTGPVRIQAKEPRPDGFCGRPVGPGAGGGAGRLPVRGRVPTARPTSPWPR